MLRSFDCGDFLRSQARITLLVFAGQRCRIEIAIERIGDDAIREPVFGIALFQQCLRDQLAVAICDRLRDDWLPV